MSGDPEQDYLADGISENIITALSYIPEIFVIARNSSFSYKGKPVKVQQISEELGVLAWTYKIDASFGYTDSKDNSIKLSAELAKKSVAMNDKDPSVHSLFSLLYLIQGNHEKAVQEGKKAIALGPNVAGAFLLFGEVLIYSGYLEEAVKMCEMAMRLHPQAPLFYLGHTTLTAYYWVGRFDESLALAERLIDLGRKVGFTLGVVWGHTGSVLVKIKLGRLSEARQDAYEILKIWPWYNLDYTRSIYFYKDSANLEHWIDGLRMARIPEHPPSQ